MIETVYTIVVGIIKHLTTVFLWYLNLSDIYYIFIVALCMNVLRSLYLNPLMTCGCDNGILR